MRIVSIIHPAGHEMPMLVDKDGSVSYTHLDVYKRQTFLCGGSFQPRWALPGKHRAKDGAPTCFDSVLALHRVARQSAQGGDGIVLRPAVQCTFRCFSIFGGTLLAVFQSACRAYCRQHFRHGIAIAVFDDFTQA